MNAVLWIFIAFAFGLMLFTSLQGDLPKELSFLKADPVSAPGPAAAASAATASRVFNYEGWVVRQSGPVLEMVKGLTTAEQPGFDSPELGILCNNGKLDLRLDTRMPVTGTATTLVGVAGLKDAQWPKGTGRNIFPPVPVDVVRQLAGSGSPVGITLSYVDFGRHTFVLDPKGLKPLYDQLPATCR